MTNLITGLVEVYTTNGDNEVKIVESQNMITVGLGYSIANLMTGNQDDLIDDYVAGYMLFGFGAASTTPTPAASSYLYELALPVNLRFLNNNLIEETEYLNYLKGINYVTSADIQKSDNKLPFLKLKKSRVTAISNNAVKHTLIFDDSYDFDYSITEVGLFLRNPDLNFKSNTPLMAAYKKFTTAIKKSIGVSLKIDWTIRFNI